MKKASMQAFKFGLVGLANTALGLAVILGAMYFLAAPPVLANAVGYAAGLCLSFYGNTRWTFQQRASWGSAIRFIFAFGVSYVANIIVLLSMIHLLGAAAVVAQVVAVLSYTFVFFVLSKFFVYSRACDSDQSLAATATQTKE